MNANELDTAEQWLSHVRFLGGPPMEEMHFLTAGALLQAYILHARGQERPGAGTAGPDGRAGILAAVSPRNRACVARISLGHRGADESPRVVQDVEHADAPLALLRQEEERCCSRVCASHKLRVRKPCASWHPGKHRLKHRCACARHWRSCSFEALAHFAQAHLPEAKQTLLSVLTRTNGKGYQRLFLDEGRTMETLLKNIGARATRGTPDSSVRTLLHAFAQEYGAEETASPGKTPCWLEPLSPQEQRVLRLLVAGQTYDEIARNWSSPQHH